MTMENHKCDDSSLKTPFRYCAFVANYPLLSFGISFLVHVVALLVTVFLVTFGYDIFPVDFEKVPLTLHSDESNTRAMAFRSRFTFENKYSRYTVNGKVGQRERSDLADSLEVILKSSSENIFSIDNLERMKKVETTITSLFDYSSICLTDESVECQKPVSILRLLDTGIKKRSSLNIQNISTTPNEIIPTLLCEAYTEPKTADHVKIFFEKSYDPCLKTQATMSRMFFQFGLSLNENKMYSPKKSKRSDFQINILKPAIEDLKSEFASEGIDMYYFSKELFFDDAGKQAFHDICFVFASFVFIFIIMWIQTGSLWITFMGLYSIFTSILIANVIYRYCFGFKYFGFFNIVAIFIIIGIGADDVFVFYDTWRLTKLKSYPSYAHRLTDFYRQSGRTTFVTSLTTSLVFAVTGFSPLLAVRSFGVFSSLLVLVNYLFDLLYFPTVVMIYSVKIKPMSRNVFKMIKSMIRVIIYSQSEALYVTDRNITIPSTSVNAKSRQPSLLTRFFSKHFHSFVTHRKVKVLVPIFFCFWSLAGIYWCTRLETSTGMVELFKPSTNYGKAYRYHNKKFQRLVNSDYSDVFMLWGMHPQTMSSCDYRSSVYCDGYARWDKDFNPSPAEAQIQLKNLCERLHSLSPSEVDSLMIRRSPDNSKLDIDCFLLPMNNYLRNRGNVHTAIPLQQDKVNQLLENSSLEKIDFPKSFDNWFEVGIEYWLSQGYTGQYSSDFVKYNDFLGATLEPNQMNFINNSRVPLAVGTKLQYIVIRLGTFMNIHTLPYEKGIAIHDAYEALMTSILQKMPNTLKNGFQLTDALWHWLRVQEALVSNGLEGLGISLGLALPILILSSMNVYIGLIATLVIGLVIVCAIALLPLTGHQLGVIESINLYMVVGLSVDYVVHFAEAYQSSYNHHRTGRVKCMLEKMGLSISSGALTTFGAATFMLGAEIRLIPQFGMFVMTIVSLSYIYAMLGFTTFMALCGPEGDDGSLKTLWRRIVSKLRKENNENKDTSKEEEDAKRYQHCKSNTKESIHTIDENFEIIKSTDQRKASSRLTNHQQTPPSILPHVHSACDLRLNSSFVYGVYHSDRVIGFSPAAGWLYPFTFQHYPKHHVAFDNRHKSKQKRSFSLPSI